MKIFEKLRSKKLNSGYIQRNLGLTACCFTSITSTNTVLKEYGKQGAPEWTAVIAEEQTEGRGRGEHRFYSPRGSGIYVSFLIRPKTRFFSPAAITAAAGVAACEAIEELSAVSRPEIKWMNDIYCEGRKVVGILAESVSLENESFVVLGAGFNLHTPEGGFPDEIADRAGSIFGEKKLRFSREKMVISFYRHFRKAYDLPAQSLFDAYRERMMALGQEVVFEGRPARATGLASDYRLELTFEDGEKRYLSGGEISLKTNRLENA